MSSVRSILFSLPFWAVLVQCSPAEKQAGDVPLDSTGQASIQLQEHEGNVSLNEPREEPERAANGRDKANQFFQLIDETAGPPDILLGRMNGRLDTIIGGKDSLCLNIISVADFDNDGIGDALIENITACGGNCCGNSYFFSTYITDRGFVKTKEYGYSWDEPVIQQEDGEWSVLIRSINEGMNTDDFSEIFERLTLVKGKAKLIERFVTPEVEALKEMRAKDFDINELSEVRKLTFDLNTDGQLDTISGQLQQRWGRIQWEVVFSDGKTFEHYGGGCKRIGILGSKSNGVHNLVCDLNQVFKWKGDGYHIVIPN